MVKLIIEIQDGGIVRMIGNEEMKVIVKDYDFTEGSFTDENGCNYGFGEHSVEVKKEESEQIFQHHMNQEK